MAPTPTGTSGGVRLEWVPGALAQCRAGANGLVSQLGAKYLAKANGTLKSAGYKLGLHQVATKYIANVYCASPEAHHSNATNQTLAKLLP